jgi:hypothetical protein
MKIVKFLSLALAVAFFMSVAGVDANAANMSSPRGGVADPIADLLGDVQPQVMCVTCYIQEYECVRDVCDGMTGGFYQNCLDACTYAGNKCLANCDTGLP